MYRNTTTTKWGKRRINHTYHASNSTSNNATSKLQVPAQVPHDADECGRIVDWCTEQIMLHMHQKTLAASHSGASCVAEKFELTHFHNIDVGVWRRLYDFCLRKNGSVSNIPDMLHTLVTTLATLVFKGEANSLFLRICENMLVSDDAVLPSDKFTIMTGTLLPSDKITILTAFLGLPCDTWRPQFPVSFDGDNVSTKEMTVTPGDVETEIFSQDGCFIDKVTVCYDHRVYNFGLSAKVTKDARLVMTPPSCNQEVMTLIQRAYDEHKDTRNVNIDVLYMYDITETSVNMKLVQWSLSNVANFAERYVKTKNSGQNYDENQLVCREVLMRWISRLSDGEEVSHEAANAITQFFNRKVKASKYQVKDERLLLPYRMLRDMDKITELQTHLQESGALHRAQAIILKRHTLHKLAFDWLLDNRSTEVNQSTEANPSTEDNQLPKVNPVMFNFVKTDGTRTLLSVELWFESKASVAQVFVDSDCSDYDVRIVGDQRHVNLYGSNSLRLWLYALRQYNDDPTHQKICEETTRRTKEVTKLKQQTVDELNENMRTRTTKIHKETHWPNKPQIVYQVEPINIEATLKLGDYTITGQVHALDVSIKSENSDENATVEFGLQFGHQSIVMLLPSLQSMYDEYSQLVQVVSIPNLLRIKWMHHLRDIRDSLLAMPSETLKSLKAPTAVHIPVVHGRCSTVEQLHKRVRELVVPKGGVTETSIKEAVRMIEANHAYLTKYHGDDDGTFWGAMENADQSSVDLDDITKDTTHPDKEFFVAVYYRMYTKLIV